MDIKTVRAARRAALYLRRTAYNAFVGAGFYPARGRGRAPPLRTIGTTARLVCLRRGGVLLPTVVPADWRPLLWPPIGALPRNRLASSATGGARFAPHIGPPPVLLVTLRRGDPCGRPREGQSPSPTHRKIHFRRGRPPGRPAPCTPCMPPWGRAKIISPFAETSKGIPLTRNKKSALSESDFKADSLLRNRQDRLFLNENNILLFTKC